jgi:hypothetical protein
MLRHEHSHMADRRSHITQHEKQEHAKRKELRARVVLLLLYARQVL